MCIFDCVLENNYDIEMLYSWMLSYEYKQEKHTKINIQIKIFIYSVEKYS